MVGGSHLRVMAARSQVGVIFVRQRHLLSFIHLLLVLIHELLVYLHLRRSKSGCSNKVELGVADQFSGEPEEGFLEVVVGLGGDVVVLEVLLSVEGDRLGLDFSLLDIDFVAAKDDRDGLADTYEVAWRLLAFAARKEGIAARKKGVGGIVRCQLGTFL